ncbi:MAG: class I mannose-6-phosphate isomerase [Bacteroidales bacterium]|nr:class I mannose-6-phosphate isomerase [Bacteroidales bacterium]
MSSLYPLCFTPVPVGRVWGGDYLAKHMRPSFPSDLKIGESWELCGLEGNNSVVSNGFLSDNEINELIEVYMEDLVGEGVYRKFANEFPLSVKLLDINDYLSFQVHPSDELAKARHNAYGKAELWYVLDAAPGACMYLGFNRPMTSADFRQRCLDQTLPEVMHELNPRTGNLIYIPPGTVHAAGGGLVVVEIQQVSDITYRVYDWGRELHKETAREMHLDLAMDAIDWKPFPLPDFLPNEREKSVITPWFHLVKKTITGPLCSSNILGSSFRLLICAEGAVHIQANETVSLKKGSLSLIPASMNQYTIKPEGSSATILEIWVP